MEEENEEVQEQPIDIKKELKTLNYKLVILLILFAIIGAILGYMIGIKQCEQFYIPIINNLTSNTLPLW